MKAEKLISPPTVVESDTAIQPSDSAEGPFVIELNLSSQVVVAKAVVAAFGDQSSQCVVPRGWAR